MKKVFILLYCFLVLFSVNAQSVVIEKLGEYVEIKHIVAEPEKGSPSGFIINEIEQRLIINNEIDKEKYEITFSNSGQVVVGKLEKNVIGSAHIFSDIEISSYNSWLKIVRSGKTVLFKNDNLLMDSGIAFILKTKGDYVSFFVNDKGLPGAADTTGRVYAPAETMAFLKAYDPVKYEESLKRARHLGLVTQFQNNQVLVWGQTYYSTASLVKEYWNRVVYPRTGGQIQYDLQGNGYMDALDSKSADIWIVDSNANYLSKIDVTSSSKILSTYDNDRNYSTSTYVGFGGNIYFYVAGDDFTEVFRIRRTWGEPDMYAMAINGFTDDSYGEYVKSTLAKLGKEDLRLLRNYLFALNGYVFKDVGLTAIFDKQVWYQADPTLSMESMSLSPERQNLLKIIQAEEKKR